jgi:hypothetical protein
MGFLIQPEAAFEREGKSDPADSRTGRGQVPAAGELVANSIDAAWRYPMVDAERLTK